MARRGLRQAHDLWALIVLDAETEPLMCAVDDASIAYRQFLSAIETRKKMIANREPGLAEQTKEFADTGQRVIDLMNTVVSESRKAWTKAEATL